MRRGLTLLEVLISMFVLVVGILSVLALVAAAGFRVKQAEADDRATAMGAAMLANIEIRDYCDPERWMKTDGTAFNTSATGTWPVVIDPLYTAINSGTSGIEWFPVQAGTAPFPNLTRLTIATEGSSMPLALADRIFRHSEDLVFTATYESDRPAALIRNGVHANYGNYSCFFTVSPYKADDALQFSKKRQFEVSAVVVYKRDFAADATYGSVQFNGGGEVELTFPAAQTGTEPYATSLKPNEWLALASTEAVRWYRIVTVGEADVPEKRYATLIGPDWDPAVSAIVIPVPGAKSVHTAVVTR